jgi:hypothetical protein
MAFGIPEVIALSIHEAYCRLAYRISDRTCDLAMDFTH